MSPVTDTDLAVVLAAIDRLGQRFDARLDSIEKSVSKGRGPRPADVAMLVSMAGALGARRFTAAEAWAVRESSDLVAAFDAAFIDDAQQLGQALRRLAGVSLSGFQIDRVGERGGVALWRIQTLGNLGE